MKKLSILSVLLLMSTAVLAEPVTTSNSTATATPTAISTGSQQGQGIVLGGPGVGSGLGNNNSVTQAADLSKSVGSAFAPALTTTLTETCMGSTSVGAGFSGGSFSFGTTWRDTACVRRLDAREIKSFGDVQAAKEIMCDSDQVREAFKRVGRPCVADVQAVVVSTPNPDASVRKADIARQEMRDKHGF